MPKIVDHAVRRGEIAMAACRAIAAHGLKTATVRDIAHEANCTTGMVTYYFETKGDIVAAALRIVLERVERRLERALKKEHCDLFAILSQSLPLDKARRFETAVWISFWGVLGTHAEFRKLSRSLHLEWTALVRKCVLAGHPPSQNWTATTLDWIVTSLVVTLNGIDAGSVSTPGAYPKKVQHGLLKQQIQFLTESQIKF